MAPVTIKKASNPKLEAKKEAQRQRWAEIRSLIASGDLDAATVKLEQYQADLAEQNRVRYAEEAKRG